MTYVELKSESKKSKEEIELFLKKNNINLEDKDAIQKIFEYIKLEKQRNTLTDFIDKDVKLDIKENDLHTSKKGKITKVENNYLILHSKSGDETISLLDVLEVYQIQ